MFLVEQNAFHALKLAHRGYVMVNGPITLQGSGRELLAAAGNPRRLSRRGPLMDGVLWSRIRLTACSPSSSSR